MKKFVFIIVALVVAVYMFGCAKKEQSTTEMPTEDLGQPDTQAITTPGVSIETDAPPSLKGMRQAGNAPSLPLKIRGAETIQEQLKNKGYYEGPIDNKIGPKTRAGIKDFQKAEGLKEDGIVGPETSWALFGKDIQTALKNAGFYAGDIDGKAGSMTKKAIEEFQKAKGLKVDGIVGAETWSELRIYLDSSAARQQRKNNRPNFKNKGRF